jgi:antitoxin component of MazEF toxin-antitoxin module
MLTATLRNWGGSVALPIPKALLSLVSLSAGNQVSLDVQNGKLVIAPSAVKYTAAQLMKEHKALKIPRDDAWLDFEDLPSERV